MPDRYETLWDLTCHYHIALAQFEPLAKRTKSHVSLKQFASYLFRNLESNSGEAICELAPLTPSEGPTTVDAGKARSPRHLLHKKKRGAEDDILIDADVMPQDIDKDIEQSNDAYEGDVNQSLFDEANKESEDPPTGSVSPQPFFTDIHKKSEDAPPGEVPPPENYRIDTALEAEINEGEKVFPPAKELLTCTDTLREDTRMEIKQSEDAPPPTPDTSTDDENAPSRFSRALNKRKRGARGAREKVAVAAPLKWKRCRRVVKPSKWVVTPYTEGKKKKEKDNIGGQGYNRSGWGGGSVGARKGSRVGSCSATK
ncbi:uncharacterized protein A4U43_C04F12470 [Asparagus officinalis]|uniref:Uncharacterized protein n=1 Tax=Asparagus officinalis TaxID=4686 RepID=A0A5P1F0A5_ASPOF|nr:uncharacterized protein A4U43_C04F12470 [Asparagus officinalis]